MADSLAALKAFLRRDAIAARRELADRGIRNRAIAQRLSELPAFKSANALLAYVSKPEEADTRDIIEQALERNAAVYVPRALNDGQLEWVSVQSLDELVPGDFGVMEPAADAEPASPPSEAVALIPGVAFDRNGNRLGWGQGYFDRFLAAFEGVAVGLAYDCQIYEELPHEPHDRPVAIVVTESETITTAGRTSP
jgi:5-formyltetrahydrofolate cyclo-ligase